VLILKEMEERSGISERRAEMGSPSGMASTEWAEVKVDAGRYANRVFCKESAEVIEKKGGPRKKSAKSDRESAKVREAYPHRIPLSR
jgi:hypothetical protein